MNLTDPEARLALDEVMLRVLSLSSAQMESIRDAVMDLRRLSRSASRLHAGAALQQED
jgi:hypothetical protein